MKVFSYCRVVLLIIAFSFLNGCAHPPSSEEMASWNYGPYPDNYEQIIKNAMITRLVDPYSAQYHFDGPPVQRYMAKPFGMGTEYGWGGIVLVNAKNRMGGYVGATPYAYIIRNGSLVVFEENFRTQ